MRYIIHLLPAEAQRQAFDAARARIAAVIGHNRALDYPTAHITLIWAIQDQPADPAPIDPAALVALLERYRDSGPITMPLGEPADTQEHLLFTLANPPALATLRRALYDNVWQLAAGPNNEHLERADRMREQTWPHLTFAQEITPAQFTQAQVVLQQEDPALLQAPIVGSTLALIARDIDAGEPYRIIATVPL